MGKSTIVIGLTGPTGAGKSTFATAFEDLGCKIIDCDRIAREIVMQSDCIKVLIKEFGQDILEKGVLNRRLLAERAFKDSNSAKKLNEITHPIILNRLKEQIDVYKKQGIPAVVVDAALLFESGADHLCDVTVAVTAENKIRMNRIMKRDGIDKKLAYSRISAQQPNEYYQTKASYYMSGTLELSQVSQSVQELFNRILRDIYTS